MRVKLKQGICLLLLSALLTSASVSADDDDDDFDDDFDDKITDIIEKEREKAEERAEKLLESLLERRFGDKYDLDDFEDQIEYWLEKQIEASGTDESIEDRIERELEKHLELMVDDDSKTEEQLDFIDEKLQQLWQLEDDLEESLLPSLPNQMIALLSLEELNEAKAQGAIVLHQEGLAELGAILVTFDSSQSINIDTEPNHLYQLDALTSTKAPVNALTQAKVMGVKQTLAAKQRVGLMDSSIDLNHACFAGLNVNQKSFHDKAQPSFEHGTAMASIILGDNRCDAQGLLNNAELFNAVVFAQNKSGAVVATAAQLVTGLNWLLSQQVSIINMSLSGPPNRILENALQQVAARGITLVASAGNDGKAAFPRYPAAYPEVIAVTALDQDLNVFDRAAQGAHIELAAPGVNILIAKGQAYGSLSGTSLAAAMVTAVLASDAADSKRLDLTLRTKNLGEAGRDTVYGLGLLQK